MGFSLQESCMCVCVHVSDMYLCVHVYMVCIWYTQVWVHVYMYAEAKGQHQVSSLIAAHIIIVYYYRCY